MRILGKIKILTIIKFVIYLVLGVTIPFLFCAFFSILSYENNELTIAIIYLIFGGFAHFGFRNLGRKIGLISKRKIYWLEWTLTISALFFWLLNALVLVVKYYSMNN